MSLAKTRIAARLLAVAALAALTAGCFQPMYAEHADGTPFFALGDTWWPLGANRFRWYDDEQQRLSGQF